MLGFMIFWFDLRKEPIASIFKDCRLQKLSTNS
jgi:hypothetical protein